MANLSVQDIDLDGVELSYVAATVEDTFSNSYEDLVLFITNNDSVSHTATLVAQKECNQGFLHDQDITISANATRVISNIDRSRFNDDIGEVHITYDDNVNIEVAVGK